MTPRRLTPPLQSLPPILDNKHQISTQSYSKGARGLSVQPRVLGIFTETTISPDPSLRQRPSRYAIRAGRNLPDKEFRLKPYPEYPGRNGRSFRRQLPACRHADGTISSSSGLDVWRMVSEDSDQLVSGLPPVHRLRDACDLDQPLTGSMSTVLHHPDAPRELREVVPFGRGQRVPFEERDHDVEQIGTSSDDVPKQMFLVVVVPPVHDDLAHAKERVNPLE